MTRDQPTATPDGEALAPSQRRAVLRIGGLSIAMALSVPLYYGALALYPPLASVVPPLAPLALTTVGICAGLPATFAYAHLLADRSRVSESAGVPDYGVNDRWERQNL